MMYNEFDVAYFDHIAAMLDHLIKRGWIEYNKLVLHGQMARSTLSKSL